MIFTSIITLDLVTWLLSKSVSQIDKGLVS